MIEAARATFKPTGRVLATLQEDGSRRWLEPTVSRGRFLTRRRVLAYVLIAVYALLPRLRIDGKPALLLDIVERRFTLLGTTFFATDTVFLMLGLVAAVILVFLLTALFGRVWCGWACPQTVYMEFLYRPVERLFLGNAVERRRREKAGDLGLRRAAMYVAYAGLSFALANVFLAYFVGTDALERWVTRPPWEHPSGFAVVAVTTGLMLFDFAVLREQVCLVACPYGRLQSVLLDRSSLIVAYDAARGEPRRKPGNKAAREAKAPTVESILLPSRGDCVDCNACVATCPTGIDIRDGLQMECIHCAQCIDACDAIMDRVGRPRGLIGYGSQDGLAGKPSGWLRPRVVLYPLLLAGVLALLVLALAARTPAEVTLLRGIGTPFTVMDDGSISNQVRVKVRNRTDAPRRYRLRVEDDAPLRVVTPENPLPVPPGKIVETSVFVIAPKDALRGGARVVRVIVEDEAGGEGAASIATPFPILGPLEAER